MKLSWRLVSGCHWLDRDCTVEGYRGQVACHVAPLGEAWIVAEGNIDVRGTRAISKDVPVGVREIRLFALDAEAPAETLDKLIQVIECYCVVLQPLRQPPAIRFTRARLAAADTR